MLPSWCQDAVTIVRPAEVASRGTTVRDWSSATTHEVRGCSVQTPTTAMDLAGRYQTVIRGFALLPEGADVAAGDAIEFHGHRYLVHGQPMPWRSPTGAVSHVRVDLAEWGG